MEMIECSVKSCKVNALILYGGTWVCGDCMIKLMKKEQEEKQKMVEDL